MSHKQNQRRVVFVVVPPIEELDLVGPMQVFTAANRLAGKKKYALEIATSGTDLKVEGEGGILSFFAQSLLKNLKGLRICYRGSVAESFCAFDRDDSGSLSHSIVGQQFD